MKKVAIIACGTHRASGLGCPGDWKCLKAAALGEGKFGEPSLVVAFISCQCPGHAVIPMHVQAGRLSGISPDVIHISTCFADLNPKCPYRGPEELAALIESKTGVPVVLGSHPYPIEGRKTSRGESGTDSK